MSKYFFFATGLLTKKFMQHFSPQICYMSYQSHRHKFNSVYVLKVLWITQNYGPSSVENKSQN